VPASHLRIHSRHDHLESKPPCFAESLKDYSARYVTMAGAAHGKSGACPPSALDADDVKDIPATYKRVTLNPQETLLEAVVLDSKFLLKRAIKMHADLNAKLETEYKFEPCSALVIAIKLGYVRMVQGLIEAGASLTVTPRAPLIEASRAGHLHIVKYLVELGVDVNECATLLGGDTAVEYAADARHFEVVEYLLAHGATKHVNDPATLSPGRPEDFRGMPALLSALLYGSIPSAVAMYKAGARVVRPDSSENISEYIMKRHQQQHLTNATMFYYAIAAIMRAGADILPTAAQCGDNLWATMSALGHTPASELRCMKANDAAEHMEHSLKAALQIRI
jgi:hypothetical protein